MTLDVGWRAGYDGLQHYLATKVATKSVCGRYVKDIRYDNPEVPRCPQCAKITKAVA